MGGMMANITQTEDQKRILDSEKTPVFLVDADGQTTHVVLPIADARCLFDDDLRRELQVGFDEADRGELLGWDPERIKAKGLELLRKRHEGA